VNGPTPGAVAGTTSTRQPDNWRTHAACSGAPLGLWFAPDQERATARREREDKAKAICATCPVKTQCLDEAVTDRLAGVWGGLTDEERHIRATTARPGGALDDKCGTPGGRGRHKRAGTPPCRACLDYENWRRDQSFLRAWDAAQPLIARGYTREQAAAELGVTVESVERAERTARHHRQQNAA
jgi:WhiB family redox-sensing transcriptional regulator